MRTLSDEEAPDAHLHSPSVDAALQSVPSPARSVIPFSLADRSAAPPAPAGKEFFRHARQRLSADAYAALLGAIKRLNSHAASVADVLEEARTLFGPASSDLAHAFEHLLLSSAAQG